MRVVVSGMGAVTPVGRSVAEFWAAICRGDNGIGDITRFDVRDFTFTRAGEVREFRLPPELAFLPSYADQALQFMAAAALEALRDAGLDREGNRADIGVVLSTNFGGASSGEAFLAPMHSAAVEHDCSGFYGLSFQTCADLVAGAWHLEGPAATLSLSCASGAAAIAYGCDLIRAGRAMAVLAGGYDAVSRFAWSGLSVLRTMSKDAVRPFDKNRDGTIFSDGAGALVVEELDHAQRRGARIYAEIAGYGLNNNAFHMTAPAREGAGSAAVMRMALADAGMRPEEIDHINAHGTGTKPNDVTETQAIKAVFDGHAGRMPVTSIKSGTGHMMGAAGSVEAIASILTMRDGVIPPTTNYRDPDPECDLDYVVNVKRAVKVRTVLSNSAGIGGCNAAVIFRRP